VTETPEIKFLHDISSPVSTAIFVMDMVLDNMKKRPEVNSEELAQTQQVFSLLDQIKKSIEERRQEIMRQIHEGEEP
jgi:hypothetical protein